MNGKLLFSRSPQVVVHRRQVEPQNRRQVEPQKRLQEEPENRRQVEPENRSGRPELDYK